MKLEGYFLDKRETFSSGNGFPRVPLAIFNPIADEEFHRLRTSIFLRTPDAPRTILVTSAAAEEGKTVVAVNLALAISHQPPKRAVLIDGDLRKPSALSEENRGYKGLSDYLSEDVSASEVLMKTSAANLWIIPAGAPTKNASELIGSEKMNVLLRSLKSSNHDTYVIIDSPPVLRTSEPILLSRVVDSVLLVISENTQGSVLQRMLKSLDHRKLLGIVLNQSAPRARSKYTAAYFRRSHP